MMTLQQFLDLNSSAIPAKESDLAGENGFVSALNYLSLIQVSGEDAANFLHNQLSNDVEHLPQSEARLAAYCSPKGRMLASLFYWKTSEGIFLQIPSSIQSAIQKRLQMFVLRAKAKLINVSDDYINLGLGGKAAGPSLLRWFPQLPLDVYAKVDNEAGTLIRVNDAFGHARYQWIVKKGVFEDKWPVLQEELQALDASLWRRCEILAGIAQISDKTQEQFVPQMVNFELIGGVNFKKGCYPGQEIVARSQYLGKLKRRMSIASIPSTDVQAAMEVFSARDPGQPCGMIVNAELDRDAGSICLVELKVSDQEAGEIHLGSAEGPKLKFLPLPYPLLDVTE